jgi:hypothetical protein
VIPRRAGAPDASAAGWSAMRTTNDRAVTRVPSRETRRKSFEERKRRARRKPSPPRSGLTSKAWKPPSASGPSRAGDSGRCGPLGSSSGCGSRGSGGGGSGSAGTFASCCLPRGPAVAGGGR